jgi:hypothetical protein
MQRARRGVTILESVMAALLLGLVSTTIFSTVSAVAAADLRGQQRLEALELSNRLILQYLDDKNKMPSESTHIVQGRTPYRFKLNTSPVTIRFPEGSVLERNNQSTTTDVLSKTQLISVTVFEAVPLGPPDAEGRQRFNQGDRICTLSRVSHPLVAIFRNPDSVARAFTDPATALQTMQQLMEGMTPGGSRDASGQGGGRTGGGRTGNNAGSGTTDLQNFQGSRDKRNPSRSQPGNQEPTR